MRILILGSVALPVPPPIQGGTEWIAYYQAKGLAARGYSIILVGSKGTISRHAEPIGPWLDSASQVTIFEIGGGDVVTGSLMSHYDPATMEASRNLRKEMVYLSQVQQFIIDHQSEYDIILNNMRGEAVFLPIAKLLKKPFVNVMHLNLFIELAQIFGEYKTSIITISNAQRKQFSGLNYLATVYNCVDTEIFVPDVENDDYLLMVGSIGRHKNQGDAIAVAKKLGMKLILAGKIRDQDYFNEIKKDIDGQQIQYLGEIDFARKVQLYQHAKSFLFSINWEEPFGLVMIEAMSCGVPVIAYDHGAVPEVVVNGKTGFIVNTIEEMADRVKLINTIDRKACREHVKKNFSIDKMIMDYEKALFLL